MPKNEPLARVVLPDFPPGGALLVGVSGGRDSVALLHWLRARGFRRVVACHLDHGLRAESRDDARFVRGLGGKCEVSRCDVAALAKRRKLSLETAAREARFAFFARCAKRHGTRRLILAHHADDQVETFLFNLLRGTGPGGLGGMEPLSQRADGLLVARPLLGVWREEIDAYIAAHALAFREDASNADPRHTRNRIRHDALPALSAAMGRDVRVALWRAAEILRAEDATIAETTLPTYKSLEVELLRWAPLAIRRRMIHAWLKKGGVPGIGFDEVEAVRSLLDDVKRAKVNLPGARCARRRAGLIFLDAQ